MMRRGSATHPEAGQEDPRVEYILRQADNALILGQRLAEWCGHGPVLEQDIALSNIALDLLGQARNLLTYAALREGAGRSEDDLAFFREANAFRNILLVELPNRDFAYTIARQFLFDAFHRHFLERLTQCGDKGLAGIAAKSLKEARYHLRFSSEWMIRLGDGTRESHVRMQTALDDTWPYASEMLRADPVDLLAEKRGFGVNPEAVRPEYDVYVDEVLQRASLRKPDFDPYMEGGKQGRHTEHLTYILADMQWMQRTYPGLAW